MGVTVMARGRRGRGGGQQLLVLLSLLLVTLVTFLQAVVDYLQSHSIGAYMPTWQRILIITVAIMGFIGFLLAYLANSRSTRSPIP